MSLYINCFISILIVIFKFFRLDVVEGVEEEAAGSFSIRIHSPRVENFEPYYFSLNPFNHTINPWFRELWQEKFKCQLTVPKDDTVTQVCTGKENLTLNYEQVNFINFFMFFFIFSIFLIKKYQNCLF